MKQLPNLLTLMNLLCGCLAVIFATQSGIMPEYNHDGSPWMNNFGVQYISLPEKIIIASLFIFASAIFDFFDGFAARWLKVTGEMGKQLDSLADVVSFGVAPSVIIYQYLRLSFAQQENGLETSIIFLLPAFLLTLAAAWRLARFNTDPGQQHVFKGLPVPAVGLTVASLPLIYWFTNEAWLISMVLNKWFLYALVLILSFLMISKISLISFKMKDSSFKNKLPLVILILVGVAGAVFLKWAAIPLVVASYIIVSLLFKKS